MMNREDWESLVSSPGWPALKRYLMDFRAKITEQVMDGKIQATARDEAIFRAQSLKDLSEMDWETIEKFYAPEK